MLAPSALLHYIHQASFEIAPPFTPLVELSTLVGEMHSVKGLGEAERVKSTDEVLLALETGSVVQEGTEKEKEVGPEE